jgi:hypothetical protein
LTPDDVTRRACVIPDDAETIVWSLDRVTIPLDRLVALERVMIPLVIDVGPVEVTVSCPPEVATITRGALESVTVPLLRLVAEERVMSPLEMATVGALDKLTAVVGLVMVTAVVGLETVTAVVGFVTVMLSPPVEVTGANPAAAVGSETTSRSRSTVFAPTTSSDASMILPEVVLVYGS